MSPSIPKVPAHLRKFVVEQDYAAYNAVDQAVWRFVLLQVSSRLSKTAHPAYREGLDAVGISVERIPRITEMNDKLSHFGWGAVCVDGFIPPRAFQEFQAHALLPIAADIRTRGHLVYTPAPDIVHEAAGHAPILPNPEFAAYVRRIGALGRRAFARPEEKNVYQAIYELSEAKENPELSAEQVARAEVALARALEGIRETSEVARLSRLYWWTAEYGLVGSTRNYKIYGAGLLSSLWESFSCHAPNVRKLPLDLECMEVDYDITKPQPQLFVTPSFAALHDLLDRAERALAAEIGGALALLRAQESGELASIRFDSGLWVIGVLQEVGPSCAEPAWLTVGEKTAFTWEEELETEVPLEIAASNGLLLVGRFEGGSTLAELQLADLGRFWDPNGGRHRFTFESGVKLEGRLAGSKVRPGGRIKWINLADASVSLPGQPPLHVAVYRLWAAGTPLSAEAGAVTQRYHEHTAFAEKRVPGFRRFSDDDRKLMQLYEQAERAHRTGTTELLPEFARIHARLGAEYPTEWLLRWNLLESLLKSGVQTALGSRLRSELERLEVELQEREPIASGLRYLNDMH